MISKYNFEPRWFIVFIFTLAGVFVGGLGLLIWLFNGQGTFNLQKIHPGKNSYKFINPLLAVDTSDKNQFLENPIFNAKLTGLIQKSQNNNEVVNAAVYFRDLESGRWAGVNENSNFSPGKLLKIPIMMAYLQQETENPGFLNQKFVYKLDLQAPASSSLDIGQSYSVEELINSIFASDDDLAANILYDNIDKNSLQALYSDLGIYFPEYKTGDDLLSIKQFSLFFRVLYNATYLNRNNSERALEILGQNSWKDGLVLTLPKNLMITHRYHTRSYKENGKVLVESHSCGIIYYPDHPYLLCAMGVSDSNQKIDNLFNTISQFVYNDFNNRYK